MQQISAAAVLLFGFLGPAFGQTAPTTIYDQRNDPTTIRDAALSTTNFGRFLRSASGEMIFATVPDQVKPIARGSGISAGLFGVTRTKPNGNYDGGATAFIVQQGKKVAVIDKDELAGLIQFFDTVEKLDNDNPLEHQQHAPMYAYGTRGGFWVVICIYVKGRLATDFVLGQDQISLPEKEFAAFRQAVADAQKSLKPDDKK